MKPLFAVAVAALCASAATAADPPATSGTPPTTAAPVILGTPGTPVVEYAPAVPARRGLFGRLRNRNNATPYSTPVMTAPTTGTITPAPTPAPAPAPMPGAVPAPLPVRPNGSSYYMPGPSGTIILTSGTTPTGTMTATEMMVMTTEYTEPARRRGLFSRLRNR
jgi:hypothetical protein